MKLSFADNVTTDQAGPKDTITETYLIVYTVKWEYFKPQESTFVTIRESVVDALASEHT